MKITEQIDELLALAERQSWTSAPSQSTAFRNRTPALLRVLRALLVERDAQMPYMGATDADYARARSAREQTDAAIREAEEQRGSYA